VCRKLTDASCLSRACLWTAESELPSGCYRAKRAVNCMKKGLPLTLWLQIREKQLQAAREAVSTGKRELERIWSKAPSA